MKIYLPTKVKYIIDKIYQNKYEAYIVGGCVRDAILGISANDYDITTNATPDTIKEIFKDYKCIDTGITHGTVSVVIDNEIYEITTYRIDGEYKNHRKPENVDFVDKLEEDLKRRDFTINAMAYNDRDGLIDIFEGRKDIKNKVIKTVGNPDNRFKEDALRMIRAIRFSSKLGFEIEENTLKAIYNNASIIKNVSLERVTEEFNKIILSDKVENIVYLFKTNLLYYIGMGYDKRQIKYKELYENIKILNNMRKDLSERLACLDYLIKKTNINCNSFCEKLIYSKKIKNDYNTLVTLLEKYKIKNLDKIKIKKILSKVNRKLFENYMEINGSIYEDESNYNRIKNLLKEIEEQDECYSIGKLKINGNDIKMMGYKDKAVGEILRYLLEKVIENPSLNQKNLLIEQVKKAQNISENKKTYNN